MTDYELSKNAKLTAQFLIEALKSDEELLDLVFPPRPMNLEEASVFLHIPESTIKHKINEIPHEKIGKRLVFTDRDLVRWMKSRRTAKEISLNTPLQKVL